MGDLRLTSWPEVEALRRHGHNCASVSGFPLTSEELAIKTENVTNLQLGEKRAVSTALLALCWALPHRVLDKVHNAS